MLKVFIINRLIFSFFFFFFFFFCFCSFSCATTVWNGFCDCGSSFADRSVQVRFNVISNGVDTYTIFTNGDVRTVPVSWELDNILMSGYADSLGHVPTKVSWNNSVSASTLCDECILSSDVSGNVQISSLMLGALVMLSVVITVSARLF